MKTTYLPANKPAAGRYALLDELRGLDLLSMMRLSCLLGS